MVCHRLLGADMALAMGRIFSRQSKGAQICQDQCVHPGVLQLLQIGGQLFRLLPPGHGVHRGVDGNSVVVGKANGFWQLLCREIPGKSPHSEGSARQIHGIRTV